MKDLDLSSVQHMINAAEPVDSVAMELFIETFAPFGLSPNVVYPTYGLAEHTVFVCSGGHQILAVKKESLEGRAVSVLSEHSIAQPPDSSLVDLSHSSVIVGCGYPERGEGVIVRIVDPDTTLLLSADGQVHIERD
jgi:hypothetical protein